MRFVAAAVLLFLSICLAAPMLRAEENQTELPPSVPTDESPIVARALYSNGSPMQGAFLVLLARSNSSDTVYRLITDQGGRFILALGKGAYELDALYDREETAGMDYAATAIIPSGSNANATLIFYPAGSLSGRVLYKGAPAAGARVRVACPSNSFDYSRINGGVEVKSGEAGDFLFRALPTGACTVSASTNSHAGSADSAITHGKTASLQLELEDKADEPDMLSLAAIVIVLLVAVIVLLLFLLKRFFGKDAYPQMEGHIPEKTVPESRPVPKPTAAAQRDIVEEKEESIFALSNPRAKAVLSTLPDREKEILKFLFKSNGRSKRSTIQHKLLIPKTSLLRNLRSLERKRIVKLTPFGRNLVAEVDETLFR
ncbi:TPA: hypothetical protein HA225_04830 [Candidatus Micrarchaeota archaeon]|nr:hypothetical protein [Candidatus Micrarchaeota archaeon]